MKQTRYDCPYTSNENNVKHLNLHARQANQRRMTAFYLSPEGRNIEDQMEIAAYLPHEDRPRTLREMFADTEIDSDEEES